MNKKNTIKQKKRILNNQRIFLENKAIIFIFDNGEFPMFSTKIKKNCNFGSSICTKNFIRGSIQGTIINIKRIKLKNGDKIWEALVHVTAMDPNDCFYTFKEKENR